MASIILLLLIYSLIEILGEAGNIGSTLRDAARDVCYFIGRQLDEAGGEHLREATDDVQRRAYLVVHLLDEGRLLAVGFELQLICACEFLVALLQLGVHAADVVHRHGERLLHADETVLQPADAVLSRTLGEVGVEMSLGDALRLVVQLFQWLDGAAHSLVADDEQQQQSDADDGPDDAAAAVAWTYKNIAKYNGSRRKIFVAGHSAGGYLLDIIGLDKRWLAKYGVDADSLAALVPFSGQCVTHYNIRKQQGIPPLQATIDQYAPLTYVRADAPPIVIISGDRELELYGRYEEQAYFWRMLKLVGHKDVTLYEMQGYDHGAMPFPAYKILKDHIKRLTEKNKK